MGINSELFNRAAVRGDISGFAISTAIALQHVANALEKLQSDRGTDIGEEIARVRKEAADIENIFDRLTGWEPE